VFYHFVEAGITNNDECDLESNCSESSNWDFETFVTTELQSSEISIENMEEPSVEEQTSGFNDHSVNLWSPVHPPYSPVPIMSQEHQSYMEEQELECSNSLCFEDVLHSPVHPPYSPLPITSQEESEHVNSTFGFKLVGDNVDKDVKPRHMRINHQTKSLHYFNVLAIQDRIPTFHLSEERMSTPTLEINDFLPSNNDYTALKNSFAILISRILCNHMEFFKKVFGKHVTYHIPHKYSAEMCKPSNVVSVQLIAAVLILNMYGWMLHDQELIVWEYILAILLTFVYMLIIILLGTTRSAVKKRDEI